MNRLTVTGMVLRHADYREYDRMVSLFTPDHGKLDAVVRGCRKPKSPLINAVEPFVSGEFELVMRNEKYTVDQCRINESFYPIRTDYDRLRHGAYWLRLLDTALMPEEAAPALFLKTQKALAFLSWSELPLPLITMAFEMHLMAELGFSPMMDRCLKCGAPVDGDARFDGLAGGVTCLKCGVGTKVSNGARRIIMKLPRTAFEKIDLLPDRPEWPEAAALFRQYVNNRLHQEKYCPD